MAEKKSFDELSEDEKVAAVRERMQLGDSNAKAAEALGTTPGTIAGIRFRKSIPSKNRATAAKRKSKPAKRASAKKSKRKAAPKKPPGRMAAQAPEPIAPQVRELPLPPSADEPPLPEPPGKPMPPYKLAVSRFTSCDAKWEDGRLCDYEREEGSHLCKLHDWMRKHPRT